MNSRQSGTLFFFLYVTSSSTFAFAPQGLPFSSHDKLFSIDTAGSANGVNSVSTGPTIISRLYQSSIRMDAGPTTEAEASQQIKSFVGNTSNNENAPVSEIGTTNISFLELMGRTIQSEQFKRKLLNCMILLCSFGFAAYTILSIDNGMTRGWSSSEIAMRIPLDNWLNYENSLSDRPIVTKTMINVIIYLLGDWLSQTIFCGKNVLDFDVGRTLRNGFIGLCFGPLVHEYYQFSDHILPVEGGMLNRFEKILMDQTIYLTVKCSIYISAVGLLGGDDLPTVKENVKTKLPDIVLTAWKFWPLVHLVTYGFIPARHRILWVNCVDLVWNAILAGMSQRGKPEEESALGVDEPPLLTAVPPENNMNSSSLHEDIVQQESQAVIAKSNAPDASHSLLAGE